MCRKQHLPIRKIGILTTSSTVYLGTFYEWMHLNTLVYYKRINYLSHFIERYLTETFWQFAKTKHLKSVKVDLVEASFYCTPSKLFKMLKIMLWGLFTRTTILQMKHNFNTMDGLWVINCIEAIFNRSWRPYLQWSILLTFYGCSLRV